MEMFKLLTRSTNLQKSAPASRIATTHNVPSAGVSSQIQEHERYEKSSYPLVPSESRKTKRKRDLENNEQGLAVSGQLDFFNAGAQRLISNTTPVVDRSQANDGEQQAESNYSLNGETAPPLSQEECRRELKRNKVKITVLDGDHTAEIKPRKRQRIALEELTSKNVAHILLSPQPIICFKELRQKYRISKRLAENLDSQGYVDTTEVQLGSFPLLLGSDEDRGLVVEGASRNKKPKRSHVDLLTVAPTGSGKTLAFMLSLLHVLIEDKHENNIAASGKEGEHQVQALVIAPTHELADQIVNEGRKLAFGTGVKIAGMRKGMKLQAGYPNATSESTSESLTSPTGKHRNDDHDPTRKSLVKADIVVSTPLMLLHALSPSPESPPDELPTVRYLVLDEADVLLDPLFRTQTLGIWAACSNPLMQVSLWSATIGSSIESLARSFIVERRRKLKISKTSKISPHLIIRLVVGLKDSAIPNISHRLVYAATEQGKLLGLRQLMHPTTTSVDSGRSLQPPFLIFTQTIPRAVALHSELLYDIPPEAGGSSRIAVLHSDLSDSARSAIMAGFRKGKIWVLITTDLLSRGVDFRGLNGVVNFDIPNTGASYVHRVGRTGRQGRKGGVAVTFYTKEDIPYVKSIANVIAASEKVLVKAGDAGEGTMQKWLLDALPALSKKSKKELKMKGVEGRRSRPGDGETGKGPKRMRISTKSGYDRKLENRIKGAVLGSQRRREEERVLDGSVSEDDEWGGLQD